MKLNKDLLRDILLYVEANQSSSFDDISSDQITEHFKNKYSFDEIYYHSQKLQEAGFIKFQPYMGPSFSIEAITYNGHEFLDNIRDDGVWKETKSVASKFSSVSASFLSKIAAGILTELINKQMGI